ncbi:hypothetical protein V5O39_08270 [Pseudomonas parakoreensis]
MIAIVRPLAASPVASPITGRVFGDIECAVDLAELFRVLLEDAFYYRAFCLSWRGQGVKVHFTAGGEKNPDSE